jgi:hypothetical protein
MNVGSGPASRPPPSTQQAGPTKTSGPQTPPDATTTPPPTTGASQQSTFDAGAPAQAGGPPAQPDAAAQLKNPALQNDPTLASVARGESVVSTGAKGEFVKRIQDALTKSISPLPKFGSDASYGPETAGAVKQLQLEAGLPQTGTVDAATLKALDRVSSSKVRYPEYDQMFKDGRLDATIAIGYSEMGSHIEQRKQVLEQLDKRGFQRVDVKSMSDDELKKAGIDPAHVDRDASYFVKPFQANGKDVTAVVRLIDPSDPHAKASFTDAMSNDELVMYAGHSRHGIGPDFDDVHSPDGNYVMGKAASKNDVVTNGTNDLARTAMPDKYQMLMFSSCTSTDYVADLRKVPANKNAANLDIIATKKPVDFANYSGNLFTVLDGVMNQLSFVDMKQQLDARNGRGAFTVDGARGNQFQPTPPSS